MDDILNTNCVTTECGHTFHASCLMRSVAHQGFGCPYCRAVMAEVPEDDEDDDEEVDEDDDRNPDEFALRGLRFFTNNLDGEEHDHEDVLEEQEDMEQEEDQEEVIVKPTAAFIAQKLIEQGVTMEQLVKAMLKDHDEYEREEEECLRADDELFGRLRIIISNYEEPQEVETVQPEPKIEAPPRRPIMTHV